MNVIGRRMGSPKVSRPTKTAVARRLWRFVVIVASTASLEHSVARAWPATGYVRAIAREVLEVRVLVTEAPDPVRDGVFDVHGESGDALRDCTHAPPCVTAVRTTAAPERFQNAPPPTLASKALAGATRSIGQPRPVRPTGTRHAIHPHTFRTTAREREPHRRRAATRRWRDEHEAGSTHPTPRQRG